MTLTTTALTKDRITHLIHEKFGFPTKEAKEILEITLEEIKSTLGSGSQVKINGFGVWSVREKKSRPGRNPSTGKKIEIAARKVVIFRPSDKLREGVNRRGNSA